MPLYWQIITVNIIYCTTISEAIRKFTCFDNKQKGFSSINRKIMQCSYWEGLLNTVIFLVLIMWSVFFYFSYFFYTTLTNAKAVVKIDCLKSNKDLVDSLISLPINLLFVIVNWLCTEIYIIIIINCILRSGPKIQGNHWWSYLTPWV